MRKSAKPKQVESKRPKYRVTVFSAFLVALLSDQLSKHFASNAGFVEINSGISFGLFSGISLTLILILLFVAFFQWTCSGLQKTHPVLTGFFLGGAMSNIVDRLVLGGVRDFLPLPFVPVVNNLADWYIVGSLLLLAAFEFLDLKKSA